VSCVVDTYAKHTCNIDIHQCDYSQHMLSELRS
jgi:hypothetical protein